MARPVADTSGGSFKVRLGTSLAVQWLGLRAFTAWALVQSLVGELRSHKPRGTAKEGKKKKGKVRQAIGEQ